ncbi:MAG: cytochrome c3 family protein [Bacteriovoracia bacterium]
MSGNSGFGLGSLSVAQKLLLVIAVVVMGGVGIATVAAVFPSASNQGYAPTQPIPFSHKQHAGDLKIDCRYCHTAADKSRHASIPAVGTCMNCHRVVKTDSPWIQKLHEHYNEGKPVEWVRIHELPDFVFFNHARHVQKGVACQTCHGEVQTMAKVYQHASLSMGWCLDCHRGKTTPPDVAKRIHPDVADPTGLHVAPVNCSTCHY